MARPGKRRRAERTRLEDVLRGDAGDRAAVVAADHGDPHRYLGPHRARCGGEDGTVVRVFRPGVERVELVPAAKGAAAVEMTALGDGLFAAWRPAVDPATAYLLRLDGGSQEIDDPYRFPPTVRDFDLYLASEGTHLRLWDCLGARPHRALGVAGFAFAVWAPNALRVSVVGDFCGWDGRVFPMRRLGQSGIFEIFLPGFRTGDVYKLEVLSPDGQRILKADPLARFAEVPPETASRTFRSSHTWTDQAWMEAAAKRDVTRQPMAIYEVHLGSWMEAAALGNGPPSRPNGEPAGPPPQDLGGETPRLTYREFAKALVEHVKLLGFNYVELLPVAEHPYDGSWGYQITGFYAPTSRYGDPDDFRYFVDHCHRHGIGVILDWVPAHFVTDAHGLGRFDGTALYEHQDPRQGLHPDWGTYVFNYGRHEVRGFLLANALYWLDEFHVDGLRVDAVASMLYLDYSREDGEWIPNEHGGKEDLAAVALLQKVNAEIAARYPGRFMIAEESTTWPGVTRKVSEGGLGFTFKWNMGWMHDTLAYFATDPLFRPGLHDQLTFAMMYEYSEHFISPLSHDEVVHGKRSLLGKMPGDAWQQLANLRTLYAYQLTRPGKKLLFMGSELAPIREWDHETGLDWYLLGDPARRGVFLLLCDLGAIYRRHPCLWESDPDPEGFRWIACWDKQHSVVSYERRGVSDPEDDGGDRLLVILNLTPVPREGYRLGAPVPGRYRRLLSTDAARYGGSGFPNPEELDTEERPADGFEQSLVLTLPPLAALVLQPAEPQARRSTAASCGYPARRSRR